MLVARTWYLGDHCLKEAGAIKAKVKLRRFSQQVSKNRSVEGF